MNMSANCGRIMPRKEYWDTCLFIAYLQNKDHEHGMRRRSDLLDYDGKIGSPPLKIKVPIIPLNSQPLLGVQH